ncbi:MFS transporter [Desertibacillus haloalkaliphilus]|uniref:MFS transporter n=1 Tax=Desertibacillus haloalkaliphilus TaxID=1328930 RepID=UPI001C256465|nr:MFS transporter [Desertibacillus haloalkaliphilus]MBU8906783.1 MFS transporter [Desertibacillus haloalkaliphilus]
MKKWHKGWLILGLIVLSVLSCLGFGRFSFGAILPFMKEGLSLDYRDTGLIASSIFFGYLIAVTIVGFFVIRFTAKAVIVVSLTIIALAMVITAQAQGFWMAYLGCFLIGIGTGGAYVPSLGLIGQWFTQKKRGMAMGIAMAGSGIGIVFSGLIVPVLVTENGVDGWRISWYVLATLIIGIAMLNFFLLRNRPEDASLQPIGPKETARKQNDTKSNQIETTTVYRNKTLWLIGLIYLFWGFSYLSFSTFLVDYLISDRSFTDNRAGTFFAIGGLASIISGFIWGAVSDRIGRMASLSIVLFIQFLVLLGLSFTTSPFVILSLIISYGITLWGVPTVMNASVGDYIAPSYVPVAMGFITLFFSIGQLISPVITGYLIEFSQSYFSAFLLATLISFIASISAYKLHRNEVNQATIELETKSVSMK